jgi:hypothetical protein
MDPQDSMAAAQALSLQVAAEVPNDPIRSHFPRRSHRIAAMTDRSVLRSISAAVGFFAATNMDQARACAQAVVPFISLALVPAHPLPAARLASGCVTRLGCRIRSRSRQQLAPFGKRQIISDRSSNTRGCCIRGRHVALAGPSGAGWRRHFDRDDLLTLSNRRHRS